MWHRSHPSVVGWIAPQQVLRHITQHRREAIHLLDVAQAHSAAPEPRPTHQQKGQKWGSATVSNREKCYVYRELKESMGIVHGIRLKGIYIGYTFYG